MEAATAALFAAFVAVVCSALFLALYRLVVGSGRPFGRDLGASAIVAFATALAWLSMSAIAKAPGVNQSVNVGKFVLPAVALLIFVLGVRSARNFAGHPDARSWPSDLLPFAVTAVLASVGFLFLGALSALD
jgi:hypothetical protein